MFNSYDEQTQVDRLLELESIKTYFNGVKPSSKTLYNVLGLYGSLNVVHKHHTNWCLVRRDDGSSFVGRGLSSYSAALDCLANILFLHVECQEDSLNKEAVKGISELERMLAERKNK